MLQTFDQMMTNKGADRAQLHGIEQNLQTIRRAQSAVLLGRKYLWHRGQASDELTWAGGTVCPVKFEIPRRPDRTGNLTPVLHWMEEQQ